MSDRTALRTDAWTGTYRLQLHGGFTLAAAAQTLPYLASLGVSHVYLSPCLQAYAGSQHGYDVTDPSRISEELGGDQAWGQFVASARAQGLRILLDIVPNHMSLSAANPWWEDVLVNGPYSPFFSYFDFRSINARGWRVKLSLLGRPYGEVIRDGELRIELVDGWPRVRHHDLSWPLAPPSWGIILGDSHRDTAPFTALEGLQSAASPSAEERAAYEEHTAYARRIWAQTQKSDGLRACVQRINSDHDALHAVLQRQYYSLHSWRLAGELTNYRRFFDITSLIGTRTDLSQVFTATHRRIQRMISAGEIDGVRVDHPDGLKEPLKYFHRLRRMLPSGRIYLEKILEGDERLHADWPVDGTVGYDFLAKVNRMWMDDQRGHALTAIYADFTGHRVDVGALVREKKRSILDTTFRIDLDRLAATALELARSQWQTSDLSPRALREAIARVTTELPVYRTYRTVDTLHVDCKRILTDAIQSARLASPDIFDTGVYAFLLALLLKAHLSAPELAFVEAWQQLAPAVMAKGVEDTIFYCFDRLLSANEVGAQPTMIGISSDAFHEFCHHLSEHWPNTLLATSTHDTKRSEDVRTRISLLTEIPERWSEALQRWQRLNAPAWQNQTPDRHAEYLLYQTLVGAWPIDRERCWNYMLKACREAKIATSWHQPNVGYESSIRGFIDGVYESKEFIAALEAFLAPLLQAGRVNSLAQTLIKMTAPGVPDFYQGSELWDLSLVDPDNRRPVDFELRTQMLERCRHLRADELAHEWDAGLPKLWMIARTLALRRSRPADFDAQSGYQPLVARGAHLGQLFAYQRGANLIAVVPRFMLTLQGHWEDTRISLPEGTWVNAYTEAVLNAEVTPEVLFGSFPVALLVRREA
jgi:(1->4)-alpha-D-glucan 1-alpha-D-glucosylmutase